ncbi:hypothetical protein [Halegenticoccus tardaugens]|uniref:hypothetical protein n=1 Tax=Halegenticoccus tardaugens TaxID=2071624 RepID=UPI00100B9EFE|nr:hypothetical protein [Halegenticoccus tardaugens]
MEQDFPLIVLLVMGSGMVIRGPFFGIIGAALESVSAIAIYMFTVNNVDEGVNYPALSAFGALRTRLAWRRSGVVVPDRLVCRCGRSTEAL